MMSNARALLLISLSILPFTVVGCGHSHSSLSTSSSAETTGLTGTHVASPQGKGTTQPSSTQGSQNASTSLTGGGTSSTDANQGANSKGQSQNLGTNSSTNHQGQTSTSNVQTFSTDNIDVTFYPNAWKGLGTAALIVTPPSGSDYLKQLLYVIDDNSDGLHGKASKTPTAVLLSDHAAATRLSPTGQYVAVLTSSESQGSSSIQNTLWLMAADGTSKQKLTSNVYSLVGDWLPHSNTFIYADGDGHLYSVTPGMPPKKLSISLGSGESVDAIVANPQNDSVALNVVVAGGDGKNPEQRYDKLMLWNRASGKLTTLDKTAAPDGFILAPWTNDGKKIFYWLDPDHSASIAADGLTLYEIGSQGDRQELGKTLTGATIVPVGGEEAVIQSGGSRFLYDKKTIQLWSGKKLSTLTTRGNSGSVTQFEPNLSPDGTTVSFVEGPVLSGAVTSGQGMYDWWNSLQIVTANIQTGSEHLLSSAGHGVSAPHYSPGGGRLFYLKGNQLDVTSADNTGTVTPVLSVKTGAQAYGGQWGFQVPLDISDYVR